MVDRKKNVKPNDPPGSLSQVLTIANLCKTPGVLGVADKARKSISTLSLIDKMQCSSTFPTVTWSFASGSVFICLGWYKKVVFKYICYFHKMFIVPLS